MLHGNVIFSQCISVELSVSWEMGYDIVHYDSIISIPILNVTYRNNCDRDYYFLNVCENENSLPEMLCMILDNARYEDYVKREYVKNLYGVNSNQNFCVNIGRWHSYGSSWHAYCDYDSITNKYGRGYQDIKCEYVNCHLERIYEHIRHQNNLVRVSKKTPTGAIKFNFTIDDLLPENLINSVGEQFIFLKSGETHTDTYNLIAFKILGGCFTFHTFDNVIENYVLTTEMDSVTKRTVEQKLELPETVGEYFRYSGGFNTNKVTVCFGDK